MWTIARYMAKLAANPRFKMIKPSGRGYVIGGMPTLDKRKPG
jgi:hypothetical protein